MTPDEIRFRDLAAAIAREIKGYAVDMAAAGHTEQEIIQGIVAARPAIVAFMHRRLARPTRVAHATLADAMLSLHAQIIERYGDHPDTLGDLEVKTLPTTQEGSGRRGMTIVAYPRSGVNAAATNILWSYYGDEMTGEGR